MYNLNYDNIDLKIDSYEITRLVNMALEDGSLHWCYDIKRKENIQYDAMATTEVLIKCGTLLLLDIATERAYEFNLTRFFLGLKQALPYLNAAIEGNRLNIDTIGSAGADMIVQLAVFNELRYDQHI